MKNLVPVPTKPDAPHMPCNVEAERAVLGSVLMDQKAIWPATELLTSDDFYLEPHRIVFMRMAELAAASQPIDIFTLRNELKRHEEEERIGGAPFLATLTDGIPRALNVKHYARIVKENASQRRLIALCRETGQRCLEGHGKPSEIIELHESELLKIAQRDTAAGFESAAAIMPRVYQRIEEVSARKTSVTGLPTGFADLDRLTAGLHRQNLAIIAGRPGLGKTSLCLNIAANVALRSRLSVGIFSLEMSKHELVTRLVSSEAEVDQHQVRTGNLSKEDWARINRASGAISESRLHIDESGDMTMTQLRAKAQRLALESGLHLLIVDYLQLLRGASRKYDNRTQEVTEISRGLKALAKELNIPVLAAAQLNREIEKTSRRPRLADLRESGSIEQDADLVLFIYRDEGMKPQQEAAGSAEILIGKQRNGRQGSVEVTFLRHFTKFVNAAREESQ